MRSRSRKERAWREEGAKETEGKMDGKCVRERQMRRNGRGERRHARQGTREGAGRANKYGRCLRTYLRANGHLPVFVWGFTLLASFCH
eukprot:6301411-Pyramimonas_sp.AAC.1